MIKKFKVTMEHIRLLQRTYWELDEYTEWGSWGMNPKRPFGNSDVPEDIYEICGWKMSPKQKAEGIDWEDKKARNIFKELGTVIQILIDNISLGLRPGLYINEGDEYKSKWVYSEPLISIVSVWDTNILKDDKNNMEVTYIGK